MTAPTATFSMPIAIGDLSDDALRRYEGWFRGERLRRARAAADAKLGTADLEDIQLEQMTPSQLAAYATVMDGDVSAAGQPGGIA